MTRAESRGQVEGEPLARYYEVRPNGRRWFELFEDRVIVKARSARADSEITVMLADLRPEPNFLRVRPKGFGVGLLMLVASVAAGFFAVVARQGDPNIWLSIAGGWFFVSLVFLWKTGTKIEFIQFVSHHGRALLDVAHAGPQRANFRPFVETLISQIRANQRIDS
jgi:hypothetical protein